MARRPRFSFPGLPQHLIQRGNNRQIAFFAEADYRFYLKCLGDAARKYGCLIHAYVLMSNHVHLLATPLERHALSRTMQHLGRRYVRYVNDVYRRTGTLWEGRFKASLVDTESYFLRCCRYIELNPVRARIATMPDDYRWSSYRCHALGTHDGLISTHEEYERLGHSAEQRQLAYQELFRAELSRIELEQIRTTVNQGWPLGSDRFKNEIEQALAGQRVRPSVEDRRIQQRTNLPQKAGVLLDRNGRPLGVPVGLHIVGPRYADALVLRAARAFETARPIAMPAG